MKRPYCGSGNIETDIPVAAVRDMTRPDLVYQPQITHGGRNGKKRRRKAG